MGVALVIIRFILGFSIVDHPAMGYPHGHGGHGLPLAVFQEVLQFSGLLGLLAQRSHRVSVWK